MARPAPAGLPGTPGPAGLPGAPGAVGPAGSPGGFDPSKVIFRVTDDIVVVADDLTSLSAVCAPGETAIAGGFFSSTGRLAFSDHPTGDGVSWTILIDNIGGVEGVGNGYVVCVLP